MRKDGSGVSMCYASEENVGKRRCCHMPGSIPIHIEQEGVTSLIDMEKQFTGNKSTRDFTNVTSDDIKNYVKSIADQLKKQEKADIVEILRNGGYNK